MSCKYKDNIIPSGYDEQQKAIEDQKAKFERELEKTLNFLKSKEMVEMLKEEKLFNMSYIRSNFSLDEKQLELLYDYAKFLYEYGSYEGNLIY